MNPSQYLLILKARYKIALLVLFVTVMGSLFIVQNLSKRYSASVTLVVDSRVRDPIAAMLLPNTIGTQVEIVKSNRIALKVVNLLKLDTDPTANQQWLASTGGQGKMEDWIADEIRNGLSVKSGGDLINIEYSASDPTFAAEAANAFAHAYIDATVEMKVEPAKQFANWFSEQGKAQREELETAQSRLSKFQREKGIVSKEESLDTETTKLATLSSQLTTIQELASDARSKQLSGEDTLPEVMQNSVIAGLRSEINKQEVKLKDAEINIGNNHPQYLRLRSELTELKVRLDSEIRHFTRGFGATRTVNRSKEADLKAAIEAQKRKIFALREERDKLAVLQRDVDAAQRAFDTVATRYSQTNLESNATQANVSILNPAVIPLFPSFPKPLPIMLLLSLGVGSLLGAGAAMLAEMRDRRIRSPNDLAEMLQLPVLGVIRRVENRRNIFLPKPIAARLRQS